MTKLDELFDPVELAGEVEARYVKRNTHPTLPLSIYTYSRECQYEGRWNDVTTQCRGLIVDDETGEIVARPFSKFFNVGEHEAGKPYAQTLPVEPFRVYEKVDGSLGILFFYDGYWRGASKGSFISEQARWMGRRIERRYADLSGLDTDLTYCTEIVYPANRIVVNYGDRSDLVLLAAFRADGREVSLDVAGRSWHIGSVVKTFAAGDLPDDLAAVMDYTARNRSMGDEAEMGGTDAEGYVIRFEGGVRAKSKFAEYVRLHRLLTGVTERDIWRAMAFDVLSQPHLDLGPMRLAQALKCSVDEVAMMTAAPNGAMATIVDGTPDEFDAWVQSVAARLATEAAHLADAGLSTFLRFTADPGAEDRGAFARALMAYTKDKRITAQVFALLDDKPIAPLVWHSLYPEASTPFKEDEA